MHQPELPGFPANMAKAAKLRQRRSIKGLEAVLSLSRCLEKLLGADLAGSDLHPGELGAMPRRRRGRPPINRPGVEHKREPEPTRRESLRVVTFPPPVNMNFVVSRFADECLAYQDGGQVTATPLYNRFKGWFSENFQGLPIPSQRYFGQVLSKRLRREKHGNYVYYGIVIKQTDQNGDDENASITE